MISYFQVKKITKKQNDVSFEKTGSYAGIVIHFLTVNQVLQWFFKHFNSKCLVRFLENCRSQNFWKFPQKHLWQSLFCQVSNFQLRLEFTKHVLPEEFRNIHETYIKKKRTLLLGSHFPKTTRYIIFHNTVSSVITKKRTASGWIVIFQKQLCIFSS